MQVLVTGGAGYIGSHAVRQLTSQGHEVTVLDNLCRGHRQAVPSEIPFYALDLRATDDIAQILKKHAIECVMHFAALTYVGESVEHPLMYYRNNTAGAMSLLEAMRQSEVKRLVFSSTAATYGEPERMPIEECFPQKPINPYGWSKWCVERILQDFVASDPEFGFAALRYFNVAGAASDGSLGEDHDPETHLIPNILFAAMGRREKITVFGTDYPTPDGTCVRDYVHVEDLIDAHILTMESLKNGDALFYNLGIGRGYSVKEVIQAAETVTGRTIPTEYGARRPGDPATLYASSEKIQKELGWKPKHLDIADITHSAWKWYQNHPRGYEES